MSSGVRQADILEGAEELCAEAIDHLYILELSFKDTQEEQTRQERKSALCFLRIFLFSSLLLQGGSRLDV